MKKKKEKAVDEIKDDVNPDDQIVQEDEQEEVVEELIDEDQQKIAELEAEIARLKNAYAMAYADTENIKKRLNAEAEKTRKYRIQSFALEILPVIDNLERALALPVPEDAQSFCQGIKMIHDQLILALNNEGVTEIDCLDKPFDPNFAQAVVTEAVEGKDSGIVLDVLQKGYMLKDRILRAAIVKVSE